MLEEVYVFKLATIASNTNIRFLFCSLFAISISTKILLHTLYLRSKELYTCPTAA